MKETPQARLTLNVAAVLVELWDRYGHHDVIQGIRELLERGQIELTESAKYHPLLPKLPEDEIRRQIILNHQTNQKYFGDAYQPRGFFPPEMAYDRKVAGVVAEMGYQWIIAEELSYNLELGAVDYSKIYQIEGLDLKIFFRERDASYKILSGQLGTPKLFLQELGDRINRDEFLLTAMDGETFGHHRPGMEKLLLELYRSPDLKVAQISELPDIFKKRGAVETCPATWALMEKDVEKNIPFARWDDPGNEIHELQWQLLDLAVKTVQISQPPEVVETRHAASLRKPKKQWLQARELLDRALHSDQFWWASARPWWSLEMIERGAQDLRGAIEALPGAVAEKEKARELYLKIITTGFDWQREGKVEELSHQEDEEIRMRTDEGLPKLPKEELEKMVSSIRREMLEVVKKEEYERAAQLRDRIKELEEYAGDKLKSQKSKLKSTA